ncbi:MAG: SRPBCC domain-containing protein [Pseudomonadota bacterium]
MVEPIKKMIDVPCDPHKAFAIFTENMTDWWPLEANTVSAMSGGVAQSVAIEPKVGGQVYEIKADGTREDWARVKSYRPGELLALAWHVMTPEDQATEVEIRFIAIDSGTRVELTHTGWQAMGEAAQARRDSYNSGWVRVFEERFAGACAAG